MKPKVLLFSLALLLHLGTAQAAAVQQFMPQGRIDQQTRATALFSADMAKLGDASAPVPFAVDCGQAKGTGRWVDARTWAWQLERPLQAGERCAFALRAGLAALNGEAVGGRNRVEFFAAGPWPRSILPKPGGRVDEDQAFVIDAGGPLKAASVEKNVWCEADGVGNRIPVRFVPEAQRRDILAHIHGDYGPAPLVVSCAERLPPAAKMRLVWGQGVEAENGTRSEKEESFVYAVREPFRATLSCEREKAGAPCSPLSAVTVQFSADIDASWAGQVRLVSPDAAVNRKGEAAKVREGVAIARAGDTLWIAPTGGAGLRRKTTREVVFAGPFPQNAELRIELPRDVKDDAGRSLSNAAAFPLAFRTGALPPLAKFPGNFGILELKEGGILPVTLRNVEPKVPTADLRLPGSHRFADQRLTEDGDVIAAMQALSKFESQTRTVKIQRDGKEENHLDPYYARELPFLAQRPGVARQELPKPGGPAEFEVVGIPLGKPGYHIVEIESRLLGTALLSSPKPMYVRAAVLVTNLAVHLKRGRDNALVWVTALDSGKPVADAEVRVSGCDGKGQWRGKTDAQGRAAITQALNAGVCGDEPFVFASARLGEDYSFVRSDWNQGIEPWRFGVDTWGDSGDFKIHTVFDRTLFRAGQTVSMKHIARGRDSRGFAFPDAAGLPDKLTIRHAETGTEYSQPLAWDARGSAVSQWKVPEAAKRGNYQVTLSGGRRGMTVSGEFRVADFRLPVFTGSVQGVPPRQVAPGRVPLALGLSFLNGGAAKGAPVEVSATLRPRWPTYPHYERFNFSLDFDDEALAAFGVDNGREREHLVLDKQALTLDKAGAGKLEVPLADKPKGPSELYAEMTFADPNGEIQTLHGAVELWPAAVVLGINVSDWASSKGSGNRVEIVALDTAGKPVAGQEVKVRAQRRIDYSHRRRIVGGFYAYEHHQEFVDMGEVCSGRTDSRGLFLCEPGAAEAGSIYLLAETRDGQGNVARAGRSYWVSGGGDLWFTAGNQDRIDVIPEKRAYRPGETARFQVRTPFREATALIAVEAGGIIETVVQPLSRFKPVVELPVKAEWGPNVYVSVLAVRGRVEPLKWYSFFQWGWREPAAWFKEWWSPQQPTAMVDLAKPAYRLGLAEIGVGTDGFRLQVEVVPDKAAYRPREEATVRLKVTGPDGKPAPAGSEVAFAAVDQALLELKPNESWNLLENFLQKRAYEVQTATAQSQVIGKRHFGKKAVAPGGGGGRGPARELFDTLLAWHPRVTLDAAGTAVVKVPMNDSLTEFKLVGVATAGPALFGTGSASVRTKQDLQMISGLPPLVREKDGFQALLTLRNGTARAMAVTVAAKVGDKALESRRVQLEPEGAAEVSWTAQAPEGAESLTWEFDAGEAGGAAKDRLKITQQVAPAVPVTVQQATFTRIEGRYEVPAVPPAGALPGKGGIEVGLSPRLSTPPPGLRRFFEGYPFICLEQKASIAVGLKDEKRWRIVTDGLPAYLDGDGLARYFPGEGQGSTTLTAYLLDMAALSGLALPDEARERMLRGLTAFAEGRIKPRQWSPYDDLLVRKLQALEALTRHGQTPTRIAAALEVEPLRLPTAAVIDWYLVAKRLPDLPQRAARLAAAEQELRNRLAYTGGRLGFTTEKSDFWWWMMVSGDSNAFRLIEAVLDEPGWRDDLPRLLRGAMERQVRGRWYTTTANAWASLVLDRFGSKFEREAVTGVTRASLGKATAAFDWKGAQAENPPLSLPWPASGEGKLAISHEGSGKPWAAIQVLAAVPAGEPRAFGYKVSRQVTPIQEKTPGKVSRGDLWRVTLAVDADQDMTWVVLSDPIPAGARILGDGDGRDSRIATLEEDRISRRVWPTFVERTFGFYRAYYEVVPKGHFQIDYTVRINNAGEFSLPPTRVEAMYAPDVFGEAPNGKVTVGN
ncbi:MAG: large extracellular alpha-helical protein [Rhodocyclaceae bacterium]|nr:large extracellular alpha-helical protein [Rhodocyclaceae bacterium]